MDPSDYRPVGLRRRWTTVVCILMVYIVMAAKPLRVPKHFTSRVYTCGNDMAVLCVLAAMSTDMCMGMGI